MFTFRLGLPPVLAVVLTLAFSEVGLRSCQAAGQGPPAVDAILRDWKERQEHFQTLSFGWSAETTYAKGSLPGKTPGSFGASAPGKAHEPTPAEDVTQAERRTLKIKGDWVHYRRDGPKWAPNVEKFLQGHFESSFDGADSKDFFEKTEEEPVGHPVGYVNVEKKSDITDYAIWPILLHYRAIHPTVGRFASAQWTVVQAGVMLRGRDCVLLKWAGPDGTEETIWVDTGRRSSILRHIVKTNGYVIQTDTDYQEDPQQGWVPSSWKIQSLSSDMQKIKLSSTASVTTKALNEPLSDEEFRLEFPPGTEVSDMPAKQYYFVKPSGEKRIITQEERLRGASYQDFGKTESGKARLPQQTIWRFWYFLVLPAVLATIGASLLWKRFRKNKATGEDAG